jgi:hypothetical protein
MPPSDGGTVESVASSGPAWLLLTIVLTASVTKELFFRAYPIEHLTHLTGSRWPGALLGLAAFVAAPSAGVESGPRRRRGAAIERDHDRSVLVAAQCRVHDHYPFCARCADRPARPRRPATFIESPTRPGLTAGWAPRTSAIGNLLPDLDDKRPCTRISAWSGPRLLGYSSPGLSAL